MAFLFESEKHSYRKVEAQKSKEDSSLRTKVTLPVVHPDISEPKQRVVSVFCPVILLEGRNYTSHHPLQKVLVLRKNTLLFIRLQ